MPCSPKTVTTASMMTNRVISLRELLHYRNREYLRLLKVIHTRTHQTFLCMLEDTNISLCHAYESCYTTETVREYLRLKSYTREHAKSFHACKIRTYAYVISSGNICAETPLAQSVFEDGRLREGFISFTTYPFMTFFFYRHNRHFIATRNLRSSYSTTQRGKSK